MTRFWLVLANIGRRVMEWADAHADDHERHPIDLFREAWTMPALKAREK